MSDRLKKILWISGFVLVVAGIAFAIYFVFFRQITEPVIPEPTEPTFPGDLPQPPTGVVTPPTEPPEEGFPPTGIVIPPTRRPGQLTGPTVTTRAQGGITVPQKLVDRNARFTTLNPSGDGLNYYDNSTGLFNRLTEDGEIEVLSNRVFRNVDNVTWASNTDKAVLEFPDGSNIVYNFATDESFTLPSQYKDFSFSPDSDQIAAKDIKTNPEDRWLVIVDDQGRNRQLVEHLGDNEDRVQVKWSPNNTIVATTAESIDANRAEVVFLTKNDQQLNKAIVQGRDLRYDYSPSGNKMAYSVYNATSNYLPTLWITSTAPGAIDQQRINTGLNTWADKCSFGSEDSLYCAVPNNIGELSGILESNNRSDDSIYRINTRTGQATLIAEPLYSTQIERMVVSEDGQSLFYVDASNQSVNKIDL